MSKHGWGRHGVRQGRHEFPTEAEQSLRLTVVLSKRLYYFFEGPAFGAGGPVTAYLGADGRYSFVAVCGHDVAWRFGRTVHYCEQGRLEVEVSGAP